MSSGIECGKLDEVLESIFGIPVDAEKLNRWVQGGEFETVLLGDKQVPTLRNLVRQIDERESQAAKEEINEASAAFTALANRIQAEIDTLKGIMAEAATLEPGTQATAQYNAKTGLLRLGIPRGLDGKDGENGLPGKDGADGKQGPPGPPGQAPTIDTIDCGGAYGTRLTVLDGGNATTTWSNNATV